MGKTEGIGIWAKEMKEFRLSKCMLVLGDSKGRALNVRYSVHSFKTYTWGDEDCLVNEIISKVCGYPLSGSREGTCV